MPTPTPILSAFLCLSFPPTCKRNGPAKVLTFMIRASKFGNFAVRLGQNCMVCAPFLLSRDVCV
jgi:hypothetical protein